MSALIDEIRSGRVTCEETVAGTLERIKGADPDVRAFVSVQDEGAMARARSLDALAAEEKKAMPLLGVPIALKDNICTRDVPTTCASRMLDNFISPYNAAVVDALEQAGAVIVGKTNLDEFAMGSSTENSYRGATRNPRDRERVPGGSSGGSAAAVAAGMVPLALGSDTGGSIRQPCGYCGAAGMKPTYGRVSRYGLVAFASSLDQIGPIAADVRDLGLLLSIIAVPDERDSTCARRPFADDPHLYDGNVKGLRVGIAREYLGEGLSDEVRTSIEAAADGLRKQGATLVDVSLPSVRYAISTYYIICTAEASSNLARYDGVKYGYRASGSGNDLTELYKATREEGFGEEVKRRIMLGTYVLSSGYYDAYYLKAAKVRTLIRRDFEKAFERCDAVISPVSPTPAFRIGEKRDDPLEMYLTDIYTVSANLASIPALSVPWHVPAGTLPVGVQLMAGPWREDVLLRLGYAVQQMRQDS